MAISFNDIGASIRTPGSYVEFDSSRAVQGSPAQPHVALLIGPRLAAGTVAEGVPTLTPSYEKAETFWGRGSILANMAAAFKKANPTTELWSIGIDDAVGTLGTKTITVTGTATATGTLKLYIEGELIEVAVTSGDANTVVAASIDAAITLALARPGPQLTVTTGVAVGVVTLTARNDGTLGNLVDVRMNYGPTDEDVPGVSIAIATGVTGATDPAMSVAVTAMGDTQYHTVVSAWAADALLDPLESELSDRWGPLVQKEGHAFAAIGDTLSAITSAGNARNSQHSCLIELGGVVAPSPTPPWIWAAAVAGVDAKQTQIDPARPRQTLEIPGVLPAAESDRFTRAERDILLTDGIATHTVDPAGVCRIERLITTYQTNGAAVADTAYLDILTLRTLALLRFQLRTRVALKYPRHKLAANGTAFSPGQAVVTPGIITAEFQALFREWEAAGYVEDFDQFKDELIVEINSSDPNRLDTQMGPNLINAFRVFAGQISFLL